MASVLLRGGHRPSPAVIYAEGNECRRGLGRSRPWPDTGHRLSQLRASGTHGARVQAGLEVFNKAS